VSRQRAPSLGDAPDEKTKVIRHQVQIEEDNCLGILGDSTAEAGGDEFGASHARILAEAMGRLRYNGSIVSAKTTLPTAVVCFMR
jgi:hypothetical protein